MPMVPSSQPRTTDTHALSSSVPSSLSSSSLSSSISSLRASSDFLPAAPLSNSSQSDIITSDRSVSSLSSSSKSRFFPLVLTSAPPRSASLVSMGQSQTRPAAPISPPPLSPAPSTSSSSTGGRLKRAWAGRRKKSEDITALFANTERSEKGRTREHGTASAPPPSAMPDLSEPRLERPQSRGAGGPKLLSLQNVFGGKKATPQPKPGKPSSPRPPALPPKMVASGSQPLSPSASLPAVPHKDVQAASTATAPMPHPPREQAPQVRKPSPEGCEPPASGTSGTSESTNAQEKEKVREDWRKSDSTMASHSTIRPGALSGNRSPRPVSLAESSHSATTIVPPVNKRLSALITDAEFTMFEEADRDAADDDNTRPPASGRPSPTNSLKARNRRSASLNLGNLRKTTPQDVSRSAGPSSAGRVLSESPLTSSRDTPTLTRAAAAGIIAPVNAGGSAQFAGNNIRGRLAAWTTTPPPSLPSRDERPLPAPPPPHPRRQPGSPPPVTNPTFRQTAVSMTGSLAPAAGFAMGFGKRAVEKVGRAWGGLSSSASHHSGYSSSSTAAASSSSIKVSDSASGYASSPQSGPTTGWKARRKAPHGFSGGSSISSFASTSSEDHYTISAPHLGRRLRGPRVSDSGRAAGGLVFKRDLRTCVRETAIEEMKIRLASGQPVADGRSAFKPVEARLLPALVVRCAQHILRWGVQEEGLFRVSGRSSHVTKLRTEFDVGCDYDLTECEPGDLDPHAVASIFKTFLRELPEPLLTSALMPYFESAVTDDQSNESDDQSKTVTGLGASNLTLRKPPSLSTLAMPTFAGLCSLSEVQIAALAFLISRLPAENRDLLYTVVELIKATAARSKDTKMPLGNLLLVFCPSLNMSPTLLRVLCEADPIWNGPPETMPDAAPLKNVPMSPCEEPGNAMTTAPTIDLRLPVVELDDVADSPQDESPGDDGASFVSALEPSSRIPTRSPSPAVYGTAIPPLSSSDSLDSSSFSDELASPDPPSCKATGANKSALASANSLAIPEPVDLSLNIIPRLVTNAAVPFPSTGGSVPPTPSSHAPLSHRKSYTLLSFPHLRSESSPDALGNAPHTKRPKRPSLHLLFSKKSSSSLPSASDSASPSALGANASSGNLVISAPRPIVASSPPRLDTSISSSPIHLAFEDAANQLKGKDTLRSASAMAASQPSPSTLSAPALDVRSDSGGSSIFSTPQSTPIADFYRGRTTSVFFPDTSPDISPPERARSASQASETPSISVGVAEAQQEDWMQSVLLAAHARATSAS